MGKRRSLKKQKLPYKYIRKKKVTQSSTSLKSKKSECIHRGLKIDEKTGELYFDYIDD